MQRLPLDVQYLKLLVNQSVEMPQDVTDALTQLTTLVSIEEDHSNLTPSQAPVLLQGEMGRPKYDISPQLQSLIEMSLPGSSIAKVYLRAQ